MMATLGSSTTREFRTIERLTDRALPRPVHAGTDQETHRPASVLVETNRNNGTVPATRCFSNPRNAAAAFLLAADRRAHRNVDSIRLTIEHRTHTAIASPTVQVVDTTAGENTGLVFAVSQSAGGCSKLRISRRKQTFDSNSCPASARTDTHERLFPQTPPPVANWRRALHQRRVQSHDRHFDIFGVKYAALPKIPDLIH